ncbi:MAG: hypothetical protein JSS87_01520 [Acidobacteria bacterium]|nr:hypothetical protein [Acidobacteriota bacterium]
MFSQVHDALFESLKRVLATMAAFVPGVVVLLLAVVLFALLGAGLAWVVRRFLLRVRFDEHIGRENSAGVADWSPSHSPTLLMTRLVFWGCVLLGLTVGIFGFDAAYDGRFRISGFILPYVAHSVGAIVIFLVGNVIARFLARGVLISAVNARMQYARALSLGVKWMVLVFTGALVLNNLGIGGSVVELAFGILFGGIVLTLSLAIGLGSRDIVSRSLEKTATDLNTSPAERAASEERPRTLRHF